MTSCDGTGVCQDGGGASCVECAVSGPCFEVTDTCQTSMDCILYNDCTQNCGGPGCEQDCAEKFPEGAKLFFALVECVVCQACPMDCVDLDNGFCP